LKPRHDLVIRNGCILDGSGGPPLEGDVAVNGGVIVAVGDVSGSGAQEIDAKGLHVTPGFVDIHTHYDGQAMWDQRLQPSSWHGITTAVMGNCGVGFAPVRAQDHRQLVELMEGVEDIPGAVLDQGLAWNWESFGQYMDVLEAVDHDMDVCAQLAHAPLRLYVMGERATRMEAATPQDIAQMRQLTTDAMKAGALGFSTSRTLNHRSSTGGPILCLRASHEELLGIALGMQDAGFGVFEMISDWDDLQAEFSMVRDLTAKSGRPVSFSLGQRHATPNVWKELLACTKAATADGLTIRGQSPPRPVGVLLGLQGSLNPFSDCPSYRAIANKTLAQRLATMQEPAFRRQLLSEQPAADSAPIANRLRAFEYLFPLGDPPDYEPPREASIAHEALRQNRDVKEVVYDYLIADGGRNFLFGPIANYVEFNLDVCRAMMADENTLVGLGDGGAHVSIISDASFPTYLLAHWGRDRARGRFDLGWLVKRHTSDNAKFVGLHDRGFVRPGLKADLNVIDMDRIALERPYMAADLPGGGNRLLQKARGYRATIVSGATTYIDGEATGALPGKLVRGPRQAGASVTVS
jgi:N-acyl-D-aspartate/D-glutamate deacylase